MPSTTASSCASAAATSARSSRCAARCRQARMDHRPAPQPVRTRSELGQQEFDREHGLQKFNPLFDWSESRCGPICARTTCRTTRCTIAASAASAARLAPAPSRARRGSARRALVVGKPRNQGVRPAPPGPSSDTPDRQARHEPRDRRALPAHGPSHWGSCTAASSTGWKRSDPYPARGGRRVPQCRPAVLGRQGLCGRAASGCEGVRARADFRSPSCTSTPGTTFPKRSSSATGASQNSARD